MDRTALSTLTILAICVPAFAAQPAANKQVKSQPAPQSPAAPEIALQPPAASVLLLEKYHKGAYAEVAKEGPALLATEPLNHELRLNVANSLAWTGHTKEAMAQYQMLAGTDYEQRGTLGYAHVNRWTGRPDRAAASYRKYLQGKAESASDIVEAREGLRLASRELRPQTAAQIGRASNSNDTFRTTAILSHRWRNDTGARIFEVAAGRAEENNHALRLVQRDLTFRYEDLDALFAPQIELSAQQSPRSHLFGAATVKVADMPAYITVGHLNWGRLAFDPSALRDGLTANQVGGKADFGNPLGEFGLAYNIYRISDRNTIHDANLRFVPARQPFQSVKIFTGLEARKARFNDSRYWSPEDGHYSAFAGLSADWTNSQWQGYGSIQYGVPLGGDSGNSWSAGGGVKRWLGDEWAIGFDFWAMHTPRDGGYRSSSAMLRLEKLW